MTIVSLHYRNTHLANLHFCLFFSINVWLVQLGVSLKLAWELSVLTASQAVVSTKVSSSLRSCSYGACVTSFVGLSTLCCNVCLFQCILVVFLHCKLSQMSYALALQARRLLQWQLSLLSDQLSMCGNEELDFKRKLHNLNVLVMFHYSVMKICFLVNENDLFFHSSVFSNFLVVCLSVKLF